jgi:hypothetical protein
MALLVSSCSLDASVTTDSSGRIVGVTGVRIQSTVRALAVALLLRSSELAVELRWAGDLLGGRCDTPCKSSRL